MAENAPNEELRLQAPPRRPHSQAISEDPAQNLSSSSPSARSPPIVFVKQAHNASPANYSVSPSRREDVQRRVETDAGEFSAAADRIPEDLMRYKSATALMDRLEPFIALYTSGGDAAGPRKARAVGAVAAMNHLKRLEHSGVSSAEQQRLELQFRAFAAIAEAGIGTLHGKHISLALNAVG
eukprot:CAMPEP_0172191034 /NCGR_PEP_ID=MMETSP1050-20130122/23456_1 /TAXON_ID=233186 /ORGANISM="Cryptomonas curvata, Strain CCAP979/52" /LENGTH=181 /DNA_ID=CAMNT_0012865997 /DNA_START=394 /DNA_END=936 /DNA_ORIENTATION=+